MAFKLSRRQQAGKAEAVRALRDALIHGDGIEAAVRWCIYRNVLFATALFYVMVGDWFGAEPDIREITAFVAGIRAARSGDALGFPSREAEAMIRQALGEVALAAHVDPLVISYPEMGIAELSAMFGSRQLDRDEVDDLFRRTAAMLAEKMAAQPELAAAERRWFAAGMADSPFATLPSTSSGS